MPAMKRALWGSFLTAKPVLSEPIYKIGVSVPHQFVGDVTGLITRKRGRIVSSEQKGPITNVTGFLPVSETFGLSADMRGATSGHAFWQTQFDHWEKVPESISMEVIAGIRKRRGLPEEIPRANKFIDKA
jgi:elongation factor 2